MFTKLVRVCQSVFSWLLSVTSLQELTCHMESHGVTCHPTELTFTPAEAGTWLSDPGVMQGWVDLVYCWVCEWKKIEIGEYLAKLQARAWLSRAFCTPGQHTAKRRRKCTRLSPIESPRYGGLRSHWADIHGRKWRHIIYDHVRHFVGITWHNVWS